MFPPASVLFASFFITIVSETVFVVVALWKQRSLMSTAGFVVMMHAVTHPFGAWLYYFFGVPFMVVEGTVSLIEALCYWKVLRLPLSLAVGLSIAANTSSVLVGKGIRTYLT